MGQAIAEALVSQGFQVSGWNRSPREDEAARLGITLHPALADLAAQSGILIMSLFDDAAVTSVLDELLSAPIEGCLIAETSTISPDTLKNFEARLKDKGAAAIDAPISGGPEMVLARSAGVFAGGAEKDVERFRPVAGAIAARYRHIGPLGSGMSAKIVNNMLLMGQWEALREAMLVGRSAGLPAKTILDFVCDGPAATPSVKNRIPEILGESDRVGFPVSGLVKDAALFVSVAQSLGVDVPAIRSAQHQLGLLDAAGRGDDDLAAFVGEAAKSS
jgi:3-hydroxyisobutyrate dehydrogenase